MRSEENRGRSRERKALAERNRARRGMQPFRAATSVEIAQMKAVNERRDDYRSADERRFAHALGAVAYAADPKLSALEALNVALMYEQLSWLPKTRP